MVKKRTRSYEDITQRETNSLEMELSRREEVEKEPQVSVEEARSDVPVLEYDSGRSKTRVLFLTSDEAFIDPTTDNLESFYDFARQFDEMHIIVLRAGIKPRYPSLRIKENIWVYIAHSDWWWWTPVVASEVVAKNELVFAAGFRPDVIVALEPFEAGLAAQWLGKEYQRPVQIHVREDFYTRTWRRKRKNNRWRRLLARYVLGRAASVAIATDNIRQKLQQRYDFPALPKLPRFHHFGDLREAEVTTDLHERYPQYETIMLYAAPLPYDTTLIKTIDAVKYKLANPRVGLVVLGDGRARKEAQKKIEKLGLQTQVIFETDTSLYESYLKTADLLVVTDTEGDSNETVLQGAVAGTPIIMSETELRRDLFEDGEAAFLCPPGDTKCLIKKLNSFMHEPETMTKKFKAGMQKIEAEHLHENALEYRRAFRDLVESVFEDYYAEVEETGKEVAEGNDAQDDADTATKPA